LDRAIALSDKSLADVFNRGNAVVTQTASDGNVTVVDKAKQDIQDAYDRLDDLVFQDPAPEPQPKAAPTNTKQSDAPIDDAAKPDSSQVNYFEKPIKDLQRSLGVTPDGIIGPETLKAAGKAGLSWLGNLIKDNPAVATKAVLSALGLGGTPDPNPQPQEPVNTADKPNPVEKFFQDSYDFLTQPDPQTTNPAKSIVNGLIALGQDINQTAVDAATAAQELAKDPVGNTINGVKGTAQSKIEDIKEQLDGWQWLRTTDPKVVVDSARIYFDDVIKQELAKAEENPGAYAFRKARDISATLLPDLIDGGKRTPKTTKVADELGDEAKLGNKVEDAGQPTKSDISLPGSTSDEVLTGAKNTEPTGIDSGSSMPEYLRERFAEGNAFNDSRASAYPYNELYIDDGLGGYKRLDSYNPQKGEIVSRKFSQLGDVKDSTAIGYIQEIESKYAPGSRIANVPSSGNLAGKVLQGEKILEVPVQNTPIPQSVLDTATKANVTIRDINGKIYNP
jgi:hypothetical protein